MGKDWADFLFRRRPSFIGSDKSFEEAAYAVFGAPFDGTASYRPGSRFAPLALRIASEYLELPEEHKISVCDLGDLHPTSSIEVMLKRVGEAVKRISESDKVPVILGGEHTITLASASKLEKLGGLVIFDAHLDLRAEFMDTKVNHTTWLRRLIENNNVGRVIIVGARAYTEEEKMFARKNEIQLISSLEIYLNFKASVKKLEALTSDLNNLYLSIDLDVLDPAYAPGVSNPEPGGISSTQLYELVKLVSRRTLTGLDLVEVNPLFDNGSAVAAAVYAAYHALLASLTTSSEA